MFCIVACSEEAVGAASKDLKQKIDWQQILVLFFSTLELHAEAKFPLAVNKNIYYNKYQLFLNHFCNISYSSFASYAIMKG